mgnify:FL=1
MSKLSALLTKHEGKQLKPYTDSVGKITIGIGRNLTDEGITEAECMMMFERDIAKAERDCRKEWPDLFASDALDDVRKDAFYNLAFNMGVYKPDGSPGLAGFKKTFEAVRVRDWKLAVERLKQSKWATQVQPERVSDICYMIEFGRYPEKYETS